MLSAGAFYAFPSKPTLILETISESVRILSHNYGINTLQTWSASDVAGAFVGDSVIEWIENKPLFIADVSELNFNVSFELGYAIGSKKAILLTKHRALDSADREILETGIFDTIGYKNYENSVELAELLRTYGQWRPIFQDTRVLNQKAPVYLLDAKFKTDHVSRIISRVKKARLFYRSFDPNETPRLSAPDAINNVAESRGVLVHLLPMRISDARVHNLRGAFIAGLALGMGKVLCFLQDGEDPIPLDYRDIVEVFTNQGQIDEYIADFAASLAEAFQTGTAVPLKPDGTFLERLNLGASSAENEFRDLSEYYLETDAYQRALRGDIQIVVGRKGSGKTAIFLQVRDNTRRNKQNVVLDLKPDGYKLLKFKEQILDLLSEGSFEHTITAIWEYVLLLEISRKLLEGDKHLHVNNHLLFEPYKRLEKNYHSGDYDTEGDFSERMSQLLASLAQNYRAKYSEKTLLGRAEVTEMLYLHDVADLKASVTTYLQHKAGLILLFDNLDKGWPSHGLKAEDILMLKTLIEATRKLEQEMQNILDHCKTLIFLRNDVYELLISETPDRGKEAKVTVDWTDSDLLRELLRRRMVFSGMPNNHSFDDLWRSICDSHINGEESSQYLIDRSLMRPRNLINLLYHCRGFAVNLRHTKIDRDDITKGLVAYSSDLLNEIDLEIRDVFPEAENILYHLIGTHQHLSETDLYALLETNQTFKNNPNSIIRLLLWYGVLGIVRNGGEATYIYSVNYDMNFLQGIIEKAKKSGLVYSINPAFWSILETVEN